MRKACEEYLKQFMLNCTPPGGERKPTEEDFNRIPREHLDLMIDMVLGFKGGSAYQEILTEYNKKAHSDTSFGMIVKGILAKHK